ncbi:MAG: 3-methyl-2-oxobutanoate hydroxymethyltransferase [Halobacteria archaeon]|nr:3-methyl-2-oxobutanoate hydroxymethyltransferase [Halobacteria archaeon]
MVTVRDVRQKKGDEPVTMLTAYDAPTARIVDEAGVDIALVGDSVGNVRMGHDTTLPVTLDESLSHTASVSRGVDEALVVGDMPFGSFGASVEESVGNASRYLKEAGADGVKVETPPGTEATLEPIERAVELGTPVMGHTGLTPQRIREEGYGVKGRDDDVAGDILTTARELEDAGVFSLVLEAVPEGVAERVTEAVEVPTIGIGAGRHVDGQVLVTEDLVGFTDTTPSFVKEYADVRSVYEDAVEDFVDEVDEFPSRGHTFDPVD